MMMLMITLDHPIKLAISTITTKARTPNTVIWEITQTYGNRALSDHRFDHNYDYYGQNQDDIKYDSDAFDPDIKKVDGNYDDDGDDYYSFYDDDLFSPKKGDGVVLRVPNDRRRCQGGDFTSLLYQSLQIQLSKPANTIIKACKYNY